MFIKFTAQTKSSYLYPIFVSTFISRISDYINRYLKSNYKFFYLFSSNFHRDIWVIFPMTGQFTSLKFLSLYLNTYLCWKKIFMWKAQLFSVSFLFQIIVLRVLEHDHPSPFPKKLWLHVVRIFSHM